MTAREMYAKVRIPHWEEEPLEISEEKKKFYEEELMPIETEMLIEAHISDYPEEETYEGGSSSNRGRGLVFDRREAFCEAERERIEQEEYNIDCDLFFDKDWF